MREQKKKAEKFRYNKANGMNVVNDMLKKFNTNENTHRDIHTHT